MATNFEDESSQRPHKRTGVWANETVKPKSSSDNAPKRFSRKYISDIPSSSVDNEEPLDQYQLMSKSLSAIKVSDVKSRLLKLPMLSSLSSSNVAVLLNEFNDESEIQESDSPWTRDSLFAELTSALNQSQED